MAAHRIIRANQQQPLPRCRSEGTLLDLHPKVKVPVPPPGTLTSDTSPSVGGEQGVVGGEREVVGGKREVIGGEQEVVAIRDYHPGSFTTLRFNKGEHLYVLDTSGAPWWFAHNNREMGYIPAAYVSPLGGVTESSHCSDTVTPLEGVTESSSHCNDTVAPLGGVTESSSHCSDTVTPLGGLAGSSHLSDSGMICDSVDSDDWLLGEWAGFSFKDTLSPSPNRNPFTMNPFVNGGSSLDQSFLNGGSSLDQSFVNGGSSLDQSFVNGDRSLHQSLVNRGISLDERGGRGRKSRNLITFDPLPLPLPLPLSEDNCDANAGVSSGPTAPSCGPMQNSIQPVHRDGSFLRSKRSFSLSELSVLQAQSNPVLPSSGYFTGLSAPAPDQFGSRAQYRTAWLNHRKLARSCHDLCSLGQSPGWGQTQPVETHTVCRLDSNGGVVQLPDTHVSVHVPAGHVAHGDHQHIALKALLEPPVELNTDLVSSVSPVLELKLSNMDTNTFITLEMKVNVSLKRDAPDGSCSAEVQCVRSTCREGPYTPIPNAYIYKDTVQARLDRPEPCTYVAVVVRGIQGVPGVQRYDSVWDHIQKTVTLGLYGPKHIHPSFKAVAAIFAHDCSPKTLLVNEVGGAGEAGSAPPVVLHLWGKQQFVLASPQDLMVGLYSNMSQYEVQGPGHGGPAADGPCRLIRGFQLKLGKVIHHVFSIVCQSDILSDFTLRVQVKDALGCILAQFCVQTPPPPPSAQMKSYSHQRRFLRNTEVKNKIMLSPVAASSKYTRYQDRHVTNLKFCRLIKTVKRQHKGATYLLEYKKGDVMALLSEDKITLKGHRWTKEWYVGFYQGKVGLVHVKNLVVLGKVKPVCWSGPDLTSSILLEQILKPCKFLTYIYASVRTLLMENVSSWKVFAEALGYRDAPLSLFCRAPVDSEPERVASVLEKLKEECTSNLEPRHRRSFQRELMMALLKMDCQGLVSKLLCDSVLLTTAVEVSSRWRELADRLCRMSVQQMEAYEAPHRDHNGTLDSQAMWKPAYDFLVIWASRLGGGCYRDILQELHVGLDRMRSPAPTRRWRHLTGTLVMVHCLDLLRCTAFCPDGDDLDLPV